MVEDLESLSAMWAVDAIIDPVNLDQAVLEIPKIHARWLKIYYRHRLKVKKLDNKYRVLKDQKSRYLRGKTDREEEASLGWPPNPLKLMKDETEIALEGDKDLIELATVRFYHDEMVEFAKAVIKELNSRTWQIRAAVDHRKFLAGN